MPIPVACPCGRSLRVKDEFAGRKVRCPDCSNVLAVSAVRTAVTAAPQVVPSIALACPCGRSLRVKESLVGKRVRCPDCTAILTVPHADQRTGPEQQAYHVLLEDSPAETTPQRAYPVSDSISREPPTERLPPRDRPPEPAVRPRRPRTPKSRAPRVAFERGWFGSVNAGVVGGLLMMLIAIVWFVVGLSLGIIFFYPPILLVLGFIAMVKGITGGN